MSVTPAERNAPAQEAFQAAIGLHREGRLDEAQERFQQTLLLQPTHVQAMVLLAVLFVERGRPQDALDLTARALKIDSRSLAAHIAEGHANSRLKRSAAAVASFDNALAINPNLPSAHLMRGTELHHLKSYEGALQSFDHAIECNPGLAVAHYGRGLTLTELRRHGEALDSYDRAIAIQPDHIDARVNRGVVLTQLGELDAALAGYEETIALQNDCVNAFVNRGQVLAQLQRADEAIASCNHAIGLDPNNANAYVNRGVAHAYLNQLDAAMASYDKAIALQNDHVLAHVNKSMALLAAGDFTNGWAGYEWRWRGEGAILANSGPYAQPIWRGDESLAGKVILLYSEAGLGDTIQFCRYAPLVAKLGAKVILHVQQPLLTLLKDLDAAVQVVTRDADLTDFNYCCPLLSLPLAFGTTLATIPAYAPYLHADIEQVSRWKAKLGEHRNLRVGLVWSGGFRPGQPHLWSTDKRRNIPLAKFAPLKYPGIDFYSLQKGQPAEGELARLVSDRWGGPELIDFTADLHDFSDTAALVENLDLIISVDTSTAHLAAALGKPTWILNRFDACWRWLTDRSDSPWYPSVRLYKQETPGDWSGVLDRVGRDLRQLIS